MHCGDLSGKEIQKEEDVSLYIYMADSFFCMVETNITELVSGRART